MVKLNNPMMDPTDDEWPHIGLCPNARVRAVFCDVRFVCIGQKSSYIRRCAEFMYTEFDQPQNSCFEHVENGKILKDISACADYFSMFKVGPVLLASHGIGQPSATVLLHEVFKLLSYCDCDNVKLFSMGTCGGLGVDRGTVVITNKCFDSYARADHRHAAVGCEVIHASEADCRFSQAVLCTCKKLKIKAVIGNTITCNGYFEEQGRLNGATCAYDAVQKFCFLREAHEQLGVLNMDMEAQAIASLCSRVGVRCCVIRVTSVNRMIGDSPSPCVDVHKHLEIMGKINKICQYIVTSYIKAHSYREHVYLDHPVEC